VARSEKPGAVHIELPEDIAKLPATTKPLTPLRYRRAVTDDKIINQAFEILKNAKHPIILAGNGCIRRRASKQLRIFCEKTGIGVINTFMAKGCVDMDADYCLYTIGLQSRDVVACALDSADVVLALGYDMVEYHPKLWHPNRDKKIIHIDQTYAEVDAHYVLECGVIGDIAEALEQIAVQAQPHPGEPTRGLREAINQELLDFADNASFPLKPQRILSDTRKVMAKDDILISDVGAHKMWIARLFRCEAPNTCIISNGFASMGIGVPGALAAKLVYPQKRILTITGDAGFMMNSQEIETALRVGAAFVVMIWRDNEYGLIKWHQQRRFKRTGFIDFTNPDFVKYAESFGAKGYRVESAATLIPTLEQAFASNTVAIVEVPVDYSENMKLTEKLGNLVCPI